MKDTDRIVNDFLKRVDHVRDQSQRHLDHEPYGWFNSNKNFVTERTKLVPGMLLTSRYSDQQTPFRFTCRLGTDWLGKHIANAHIANAFYEGLTKTFCETRCVIVAVLPFENVFKNVTYTNPIGQTTGVDDPFVDNVFVDNVRRSFANEIVSWSVTPGVPSRAEWFNDPGMFRLPESDITPQEFFIAIVTIARRIVVRVFDVAVITPKLGVVTVPSYMITRGLKVHVLTQKALHTSLG